MPPLRPLATQGGRGRHWIPPLKSCSAKPRPAVCPGSCGKPGLAPPLDVNTAKNLVPTGESDVPVIPTQLHHFWGLEGGDQLNAVEPEYTEVEMTLDTGATCHAADRVDFPGCLVQESPGSKAGQHFQTAGKKTIANEGQAKIELSADGVDMAMTMQIAKISRPLLSVTKMTESGELTVLCKREEALILNSKGKTVARFPKKNGLYVCMMKYKNPRYQRPEDFVRPRE